MRKARVLIVDDEPASVEPIKMYLEAAGTYIVRLEKSGTQAVPAARRFRPDVVVLDIMLPEKDGGEVAEEMRADSELSRIPILFLTAALTREEARLRHHGLVGGQHVLAKPASLKEIRQVVDRLLPSRS